MAQEDVFMAPMMGIVGEAHGTRIDPERLDAAGEREHAVVEDDDDHGDGRRRIICDEDNSSRKKFYILLVF